MLLHLVGGPLQGVGVLLRELLLLLLQEALLLCVLLNVMVLEYDRGSRACKLLVVQGEQVSRRRLLLQQALRDGGLACAEGW